MKGSLLLLGLGSNVGNRLSYLQFAVESLKVKPWNFLAASPVYETEPFGVDHTTRYLNQVVALCSDIQPLAILDLTEKLERDAGRASKGDLMPRTLDIDILLYGNLNFKSERLEIPHPGIAHRAFVLQPLHDVVPALASGFNQKGSDFIDDTVFKFYEEPPLPERKN